MIEIRNMDGTVIYTAESAIGCGGCGMDDCHVGIPCSKGEQGCRYCPARVGSAAAFENVEWWWRREAQ